MAQKALTLFFPCFFLISVIFLPQAAAQAEGGGRIDDINMGLRASVFPSRSPETASLEGGGGSPDGNDGTKVPIKPSNSSTAESKTESPSSGGRAGMESTNTPTSSSQTVTSSNIGTVNSNTEGNCNEWTFHESCSTDYIGVTVCTEEAIYKSCPGTDYYDYYPDPEDPPTDAGTFPPCPPLPNRKLLRAL